jgi:hypothetical protein
MSIGNLGQCALRHPPGNGNTKTVRTPAKTERVSAQDPLVRRASTAALLALGLVSATSVAAAERWAEFSWRAPPECPERALVLQQVEAVLQSHSVVIGSADVRGDVEHLGGEWVLSLDVLWGSERRVRRLTATRCEDLADAAAVALVLLIEPASPSPGVPPLLAIPEATAPAPASLHELADDPAPKEQPEGVAWLSSFTLGAAAVGDSATLGRPSAGASAEIHLRLFERWGLEGLGVLLPARRLDLSLGDWVEFSQWAGGLRVCHSIVQAAVGVEGCVGGEFGMLTGRGSGLNVTQNTVRDYWLAPNAGLRLSWHALPHAALFSRLEALVPLLREDYVFNRGQRAHTTPNASFRLALGIEFDLM